MLPGAVAKCSLCLRLVPLQEAGSRRPRANDDKFAGASLSWLQRPLNYVSLSVDADNRYVVSGHLLVVTSCVTYYLLGECAFNGRRVGKESSCVRGAMRLVG